MSKPKPKKHTYEPAKQRYELVILRQLECAPGKLRGHMRRRKSELAVNTGSGEVIEQFDLVEDVAEQECGDLRC
jgi:hypothetical protein